MWNLREYGNGRERTVYGVEDNDPGMHTRSLIVGSPRQNRQRPCSPNMSPFVWTLLPSTLKHWFYFISCMLSLF